MMSEEEKEGLAELLVNTDHFRVVRTQKNNFVIERRVGTDALGDPQWRLLEIYPSEGLAREESKIGNYYKFEPTRQHCIRLRNVIDMLSDALLETREGNNPDAE